MIKTFTSDLRRNLIKIFCLSTGLAIGMLIVAKVYFEQTFDASLPDAERIFLATQSLEHNGEYKEYPQTPGAVAPGLKRYVPQVEKSTRITWTLGETKIVTPDGRKLKADGAMFADSCFFDVIQTEIIQGKASEALTPEWSCMIPQSLAEKIGGDVMGMKIYSIDFGEDRAFTISGVYKDFPLNSSFSNVIYISMSTLPRVSYDGRENWMGNDRYKSYVILAKGTSPEDIEPSIQRMLEDNIEAEVLEATNFKFRLKPLLGLHIQETDIRTMNWILSILALIILTSAALNYLLIVMAQMQWRAKEMAVRKCYGTSVRQIFGMVLTEGVVYLLVSLLIASVIVASLSAECEQLLGVSAKNLLSTEKLWMLELLICLLILAITGVIPAWLYCRTPVTNAFRKNTHGKRIWKLALLSVQFFASSFLFCLLLIVGRQYDHLTDIDTGYDYTNLAMANISRIPREGRGKLVQELRRLSSVKGVATAQQDLTTGSSGNNIFKPEEPLKQVNIADFYAANPEFFEVTGMRFAQGAPFEAYADSMICQIVVDRPFINDLHKIMDFEGDEITGKMVSISEHSDNGHPEFEIRGVIDQLKRNGFNASSADTRSCVIFPTAAMCENVYINFNDMTDKSLEEARGVISTLFPNDDIVLMPVKAKLDALNAPVKRFGNSVLIAGIVIILITLIGLIGYAADDVQRRAKEIAIRKVNGMSVGSILRLFCMDVLKVALPALILGAVLAFIVGKEWLSQFTEQLPTSPLALLVVIIALLAVLMMVVVCCCLGVARANPVRYLRDE